MSKHTTEQFIEIINKLLSEIESLSESRQSENFVYIASPYDTERLSPVWK